MKISRAQYLVFATLLLTTILAITYIGDLRREKAELLGIFQDLTGIQAENENMAEQLQKRMIHVEQLQRRNDQLEDMLINRAKTYQIVTVGLDVAAVAASRDDVRLQLLSRSGWERSVPPAAVITGVNMPVRSSSGFTAAAYERAFDKLGARGMAGTGEAFVRAEEGWDINSLVLAAIAYLESGGGGSKIARDKNNLLGLGAYDSSPYQSAITFAAPADSIYFAAELLAVHYLTPGGRYYRGDDLAAIGVCYATDPRWAVKVAGTMKRIARVAVGDPDMMLAMAEEVRL